MTKSASEPGSLPNLVIIGAAKSASTFLQHCLDSHPDIFLAPGEVAFFESPDYEEQDLNSLCALFDTRKERVLGIKRPSYIGRPEAAPRIRKYLPDAKLVAVLRHPVQRAVAHYYHNVRFGLLPALTLNDGLARILGDSSFVKKHPAALEVIECGLYGKYISLFADYLQSGNLLVLRHDELVKQQKIKVNKTLEFLGVSPLEHLEVSGKRPQRVVYSMGRIRLLRLANPLLFTYNATRSRLFLREKSPWREALIDLIGKADRALCRLRLSEAKTPDPEISGRLAEFYRDDIKLLESVTGKKFDDWLDCPQC